MSGLDSVRTRLLLLVILAILPSLVLFLVTGGEQARRSAADAQAEALRLTRIVAAEQELQIQGARQLLIALAQLPAIQHRQPKACEDILAKIAPHFPAYTGMSAIYPSGEVFCNSAPTDRAINISDRDYYQRLLETRDFSMSGYLIGRATGSAVIIFVYPAIESTTGDLQAIVLTALDLTWLDHMAERANLPDGAVLTVVDENGTVLTHYPNPEQWIGKSVVDAQIIDSVLGSSEPGTTEANGIDGVSRLYGYTPLSTPSQENAAYVLIGLPTEIAFAEAKSTLQRNLIGLAIATLFSLVAAWLLGEYVLVRRIVRLVETTGSISKGDLSTRIGPPYYGGELGQLAMSIDQMAQSLQQSYENIRQAEETLRKNQSFLQGLLDFSPAAVYIKDMQGRYVLVNNYFASLIQKTPESCIGKTDDDLFDMEVATIFHHNDQQILQAGGAAEFEETILGDDGPYVYSSSKFPLYDHNGNVYALAGISNDITSRKRAEDVLRRANIELEQVARQKDEFLAAVSHELRTPLNAILGISEALDEGIYGEITEKQRTSIHRIDESGRHLLALINDILDVAQVESGKIELDIRPVEMERMCKASLQIVRTQATAKRIRISETYDSHVSTILVDERRFKQILINLLSNAVKFTDEGGQIGLIVRDDRENQAISFVVWDTGIGIAQQDIDRLFQSFVQLDSRLSRNYEGTGLGLALVARLTELHGGRVSVESEEGRGSRFIVSLPWNSKSM